MLKIDFPIEKVPQAPFLLGVAGALPFVFGTVLTLLGGQTAGWGETALLGYGAVILSFMGGIHWGIAMAQRMNTMPRLGASVVPALVGWLALLIGGSPGLVLLAAAFAAVLAYDLQASRFGATPDWYPTLRWPLTIVVVLCLVLASFRPWI